VGAISEQRKAAFDSASDVTKQLITLATGIIAISITFSKDIIGNTTAHRAFLSASWIVYVVSIVFGVWTLLAITGELEPKTTLSRDPSIRQSNVTAPSAIQILMFLAATVLLVLYAVLTFKTKATVAPGKTTGG
jgi:hypothetical protein